MERDQQQRKGRRVDTSIIVLGTILIAMAVITLRLQGWSGVSTGLLTGGKLFKTVGLQMTLGFLLAGFIQVVVPSHVISTWMGEGSGLRGILVGTVAGALAPGGPFVQFPLLAGLHRAGAALGPIAAYVTAWSVIPVMRAMIYEIPLLGMPFTVARYSLSLLLPVLIGLAVPRVVALLSRGG